jgi:predicted MPP superfamily phosphohydrolase
VTARFLSADEVDDALKRRLGRVHARQRLGIEKDHEAQKFGQGLTFFHFENLPVSHAIIGSILRASGTYWRGRANAARVRLRTNDVYLPRLPVGFDGFTILHITDLHADMSGDAIAETTRLVSPLNYDLCVLTGDYRGRTYGPYHASLNNMLPLCQALRGDVYGVLGNHDTILMVPDLERMGVRMLLNEHVMLKRNETTIFMAGIDDAHFYRVDNIEKAAADIPQDAFSILLSHTPETYKQASHAGFDLLLAGHTHGGQICLPGGRPVLTANELGHRFVRGRWQHEGMHGFTSRGAGTSGVPVRFFSRGEITLITLRRAG